MTEIRKGRSGRIAGILLSLCLIVTMMPLMAFADDDDDRAAGSLYILGRKITDAASIEAVPHEGAIAYDPASATLSFTNVVLDLDDYDMQGAENNYAAAISSWGDLRIELSGSNTIRSSTNTYAPDKQYVYGIKNSSGKTEIAGGELYIDLESAGGLKFTGIGCSRDLSVSGSTIGVSMTGPEKSTGIDLRCCDFSLDDAAQLKVAVSGEGSTAVNGSGIFDKSYIGENSVFEMTAEGTAFKCYMPSESLKAASVLVSKNAGPEGAEEWNKTDYLASFKYIRFIGAAGGRDEDRGSLYLLGRKISKTGVVSAAEVPHKGTISFDKDSNTLTLKNATLDLNDYSSAYAGNIVPGIYSTGDLNIALSGKSSIISTGDDYAKYGDGANKKEYVSGIDAWGNMVISGGSAADSLTVTLATTAKEENKNITFCGVEGDGDLIISGASVNANMGEYGKCSGFYLWGVMKLSDSSDVTAYAAGADGRGVSGVNTIGNSEVGDGSVLEMTSHGRAFNCYVPSETLKETPAVVNTAASAEGASAWDKTTSLTTYKYVRFGNRKEIPPEPVVVLKANTMKIKKTKTATVKKVKVKKKAQKISISKVLVFANKGQGALSYTKTGGSKKLSINKKSGKITVRKGTKKGTYKIKVKVKAAGNTTYKPSAAKTVTIKIKVK